MKQTYGNSMYKQVVKWHLGVWMLVFLPLSCLCQDTYWIFFTDKGDTTFYTPSDLLSEKALANRARLGISLDIRDFPVNERYLQELRTLGIRPKVASRWLNGVSAQLTNTQFDLLRNLPHIKAIRPVGKTFVAKGSETSLQNCDSIPFVNTYLQQLNMLGLDTLHEKGFRGEGVVIAVFDNGFFGVDQIEGFSHLFEENRILGTRDYVERDEDVYGSCNGCRHGTNVLSVLAGKVDSALIGTAPDASYILLRTENDSSETHQEEDNWVAAAKYADSLGAQVFSTSLGYFTFDQGEGSYTQEDLDGNTAIITRAADIAASRGIIVVNSAGNSGVNGISAPADGDSVIAVGAVNACEEVTGFSSRGFRIDGRVKPDVVALGGNVFGLRTNGRVTRLSGTSFSCPVLSGMLGCIVQAYPTADYGAIYNALIRSSNYFDNPTPEFGYGIPSVGTMQSILDEQVITSTDPVLTERFKLFPNPNTGTFLLSSFHRKITQQIYLEILDARGRRVYHQLLPISISGKTWDISTSLPAGLYYYRVRPSDNTQFFAQGKLIITSSL